MGVGKEPIAPVTSIRLGTAPGYRPGPKVRTGAAGLRTKKTRSFRELRWGGTTQNFHTVTVLHPSPKWGFMLAFSEPLFLLIWILTPVLIWGKPNCLGLLKKTWGWFLAIYKFPSGSKTFSTLGSLLSLQITARSGKGGLSTPLSCGLIPPLCLPSPVSRPEAGHGSAVLQGHRAGARQKAGTSRLLLSQNTSLEADGFAS